MSRFHKDNLNKFQFNLRKKKKSWNNMMATSKYKKDFMIFPQRKSCDSMNDQNRVTQYMD